LDEIPYKHLQDFDDICATIMRHLSGTSSMLRVVMAVGLS
jgi:hypothetical protein